MPARFFQSGALYTGLLIICMIMSCQSDHKTSSSLPVKIDTTIFEGRSPISDPLVTHMYTADPAVHLFENKIYIYPSHDIESGIPENEKGDHFNMRDYHVLSMDKIGGEITDHGVALSLEDIPWAKRQLWAPDAAEKNGKYFLYFPAKDKDDLFRIGVAMSESPAGPFEPEPAPIKNSYSIDPSVFKDDDGKFYMYFGGIWGGQLHHWHKNQYNKQAVEPRSGEVATGARVAELADNMKEFAGEIKEITLLNEGGGAILADDNRRRFFEAAWMHKYNGKYYFSYSTGDTHTICYAVGDNPYGPFTYGGIILKPVIGWTNHHSILEVGGKWYLFYHDSSLSGGETHLRNIKVTELRHLPNGSIIPIDPYVKR